MFKKVIAALDIEYNKINEPKVYRDCLKKFNENPRLFLRRYFGTRRTIDLDVLPLCNNVDISNLHNMGYLCLYISKYGLPTSTNWLKIIVNEEMNNFDLGFNISNLEFYSSLKNIPRRKISIPTNIIYKHLSIEHRTKLKEALFFQGIIYKYNYNSYRFGSKEIRKIIPKKIEIPTPFSIHLKSLNNINKLYNIN